MITMTWDMRHSSYRISARFFFLPNQNEHEMSEMRRYFALTYPIISYTNIIIEICFCLFDYQTLATSISTIKKNKSFSSGDAFSMICKLYQFWWHFIIVFRYFCLWVFSPNFISFEINTWFWPSLKFPCLMFIRWKFYTEIQNKRSK